MAPIQSPVSKIPMVAGLSIRLARIEDAKDMALLLAKAWQESYKNIIEQSYLDNLSHTLIEREKLRKKLLSTETYSIRLVVLVDNKIIGLCEAGPNRMLRRGRGEIYTIYLLEQYKGQGIGTALWNIATEWLKKEALIPFTVNVLASNRKAQNFYKKHGGIILEKLNTTIGNNNYIQLKYIFNNN